MKHKKEKYNKQRDDRSLEIAVWHHTENYIQQHSHLRQKIDPWCILYGYSNTPIPSSTTFQPGAGKITVQNIDTLSMAQSMSLVSGKGQLAVLNMASDHCRGGGVRNGARSQEENIARRSNLVTMLNANFYPFAPSTVLYSPCVTVFKDASYELCEEFQCGVLSCAALRNPRLTANGEYHADQKAIMRMKIIAILHVAIHHGIRYVVLGALGCGAFHNPPEEVAALFATLLIEEKYRFYFEEIGFAILVKNEKEQDNLIAFQKKMNGA